MKASASRSGSGEPWILSMRDRRALDRVMTGALSGPADGLVAAVTRAASSGKRLRPALVLATGRGGPDRGVTPHGAALESSLMTAAAAVEILHWATLVHDDVIDGSASRHGRPTVNAAEGVDSAIVGGDLLIGTAFRLTACLGPAVTDCLADTLTQLCVGQDLETSLRWRPGIGENDVVAVYTAKSGSLLAAAARIGGLCAGVGPETVEALTRFGSAFGISLQILDDVLDVVGSADLLGKPVGADFVNGTVTLPGLAAMRVTPELRDLLRPSLSHAERDAALSLLQAPEAVLHSIEAAREWCTTAADQLRLAAQDCPRLARIADWPAAYLEHVLSVTVDRSLAHLVSDAPGSGDASALAI